jgi:predicted transcriptional regulator
MKKNPISIFPFILLLLVACQTGEKPGKVTEKFLQAINDKDFKAAREFSTPETGKLIDLMEQLQKMSEAADSIAPVHFEIVSEKIDGDNATVTFKEKNSNESDELHLVKLEDKWLVNVTKQDLAAKDMEQSEEGDGGIFGDPNDSIVASDSLLIEQAF